MKIKRYSPGSSNYAPRRRDEEWEVHRQLLTRMHQQYYTRRQMLAALQNAGFNVTAGQLLAQLKKWDLTVRSVSAGTIAYDNDPCSHNLTITPSRTLEPDDAHDAGFIGNLRLVASEPWLADSVEDAIETEDESCTKTMPAVIVADVVETTESYGVVDPTHGESPTSPDQENDDLVELELEPETEAIVNTLNAHADSLRQQLPTILEAWCESFPTACCCRGLFSGQDGFAKSPRLYRILLDQAIPQSLLYVFALLNLADVEDPAADDLVLRDLLWSTIEYYLSICTRAEIKNSVATRVLHTLLRAWNGLYQERFPLPAMSSFRSSGLSRADLLTKIVKTKPKKPLTQELRQSRWRAKAELDIGAITGFIAKRPSTWPLVNWSGGQFGSTDGWWPVDNPKNAGLIETAAALSDHMTKTWAIEQREPNRSKLPSLEDLGACNIPLIFDTLGLMLALELSSYATDFTDGGSLLSSPSWPKELSTFIDTTMRTLSLNAEYSEKFRKTYWLISGERIGFTGKSKSIHTGQCTASKEWLVLERSIHDWDEPRTWIERHLFTNRNSWPQTEDLVTADNMSMRSVSSFNSFKRFQALALHLKIGTPHSRSIRSRSTRSKMSVDSHLSWQLEHMLDIKSDEPAVDKASLEAVAEMEEQISEENSAVLLTKASADDSQGISKLADNEPNCGSDG